MNKSAEREWLTGEFLTVASLQAWLDLGRTKTYGLIQTGEIPSHRIGRVIRVRKRDVEEWLERTRFHS